MHIPGHMEAQSTDDFLNEMFGPLGIGANQYSQYSVIVCTQESMYCTQSIVLGFRTAVHSERCYLVAKLASKLQQERNLACTLAAVWALTWSRTAV